LGIAPLLLIQREQFLPVNRDVARRFDPQSNLASVDIDDGNADIVADENLLSQFPTENQHVATLLLSAKSSMMPAELYVTNEVGGRGAVKRGR
jgi:hypothetical protein